MNKITVIINTEKTVQEIAVALKYCGDIESILVNKEKTLTSQVVNKMKVENDRNNS